MSRSVAVSLAVCFLTLSNACAEPSAPAAIPPADSIVAASIVAASPLKLTATVGTRVPTPPSVLVRDANGTPIAGALVNFSITEGEGSLSNSTARTNSSGIADVSTWQISTVAELNVVTASTPPLAPIRFEVIGVAGAPATMVKVAGDQQVAAGGSAVPIKPQVRVIDSYDNAVRDVVVSFAIEAGGGSLAGENVISDSLGIATVASWTLGTKGRQTLVATVAKLTPVKFRAVTFEDQEQCAPVAALAEATTVASELGRVGCQGVDGRFADYYVVRTTSAGTWHFKLASGEFDTRLELRTESGIPIASDRASALTTDSEIRAMLPPGRFLLIATSAAPEAAGRYDISYAPGSSHVGGCEVSIARGISTEQTVAGGKCPKIGDQYVDRYRIYLNAGSTVSVVLEDHSLSDNRMEIQDDAGNALAQAVVKNYVESTLSYRASSDGFYVISVQVSERYVLFVQ